MKQNKFVKTLDKISNVLIIYAFIFLIMKIYSLINIVHTGFRLDIDSYVNNTLILFRYIFTDLSEYFIVPLWAITIAFSIKFINNWLKNDE
jgi:hypothetical protein